MKHPTDEDLAAGAPAPAVRPTALRAQVSEQRPDKSFKGIAFPHLFEIWGTRPLAPTRKEEEKNSEIPLFWLLRQR